MEIRGELDQKASANIEIELAGTSAVAEYDVPNITDDNGSGGVAYLGGALQTLLLDKIGNPGQLFDPTPGDSFTVLTASRGLVGTFDAVELPDLGPGETWEVIYHTNGIIGDGTESVELRVNSAPVAVDDGYDGYQDTPLTIPTACWPTTGIPTTTRRMA